MPKLIAFLLVCFLSFSASAQAKLSFGGTALKSKEHNITTTNQLFQDSKLKSESREYKVASYVISILPVNGDLVGPYTITAGQDLPQTIKNVLPNARGSKIYLDDILLQNAEGKKVRSNSYVVVCQ